MAEKIARRAEGAVNEVEQMQAYTCYAHRSKDMNQMGTEHPKAADDEESCWPGDGKLLKTSNATQAPYASVFWTTTNLAKKIEAFKEFDHAGKCIVPMSGKNPVKREGREAGFKLDTDAEPRACYFCDCAGFIRGILRYFHGIPDIILEEEACADRGDRDKHLVIPAWANEKGGHSPRYFIRAFDIAYHFSSYNTDFKVEKNWKRIEDTREIKRGDIVAYGDKKSPANSHTGHVWIAISDVQDDGTYIVAESSSTVCAMLNKTHVVFQEEAYDKFRTTPFFQNTNWLSTYGVRRNRCFHHCEPHHSKKLDGYDYWGIARYTG